MTMAIPVSELKEFTRLHARAQSIPPSVSAAVVDRIRTADGEGPGSWPHEWAEEGRRFDGAGDHLMASSCFNLARFPYVDGPARREALDDCVRSFDRWRSATGGIERIDVTLEEGGFGCWVAGLSAQRRPPLLVVTGGIVSIKEQWAPLLARAERLGMALLVTEMPGVGENTLPYGPDSWRMFSHILDLVADQADVSRTVALALSFSGHLALRCGLHDDRIAGVATVGAPVRHFFSREPGAPEVPVTTADTLAHLVGVAPDDLFGVIGDWGLTDDELSRIGFPVAYVASRRDEIIPPSEAGLLRRQVSDVRVVEYDDVHGSPNHVAETRLWLLAQVMSMSGTGGLLPHVLAAGSRALRMRRALSRKGR